MLRNAGTHRELTVQASVEKRQDGSHSPLITPSRAPLAFFYGGMTIVAVLGLLAIRAVASQLWAGGPPPAYSAAPAGQTVDVLFHSLLALAVIVATTRVVGTMSTWIGQPAVVGEICGGIMLGPSLLGYVAPGAYARLLPAGTAGFLGVYAQLGVILYLFLVGLELDLRVIRKTAHAAVAISHASIVLPLLLGSALALVLYPSLSTANVSFATFALFVGVSLSITALPVLARILADRKMSHTPIGALALTCAAVDDVTAWCLLALVVSIARSRLSDAVWTIAMTLTFGVVLLRIVAPIVRRRLVPWIDRSEDLSRGALTLALVALLVSALVTDYIGIHGFFGAFLFGAIIPHDSRTAREIRRRLDDFVAVLLLPAFVAYTGMRTEIGLLTTPSHWLLCATIILVACLGKFGGTFVAARFSGLEWRDSAALGALMNTRGLVQLIVLNQGMDLGILSPTLFTMLVIMAVVTTFLTAPVLDLLKRTGLQLSAQGVDGDGDAARSTAPNDVPEYATSIASR